MSDPLPPPAAPAGGAGPYQLETMQRLLLGVRRLNQLVIYEKDPRRLIQSACELLVETRRYRAVWIALGRDSGPAGELGGAGWPADWDPFAGLLQAGRWPPCRERALATNDELVVLADATGCGACPLTGACATAGAAVTVLRHGATTLGLLGVGVPAGFAADPEARALLTELADDLAFALHALGIEAQRRASDERFRASFERAAIGMALASLDGRFLRVNDTLAAMLGYRRDEVEGRPFAEFTHPDDQAASRQATKALIVGAAVQRLEKRYRRKDGAVVWADLNVAAARDASGRAEYFVATFIDVTDRKRAEAALAESEARFAAAFRSSPVAMAMTSVTDGAYHDVNEAFLRDTGFTRAEVLGRTSAAIGVFVDSVDRDRLAEAVRRDGHAYGVPMMWRTKPGRLIDVLISTGVVGSGGAPYYLSSILDVSELRQAERELQYRNVLLATQQEASIDGILVVDDDGRIRSYNRRFVEIWGLPQEVVDSGSDERALAAVRDRLRDPDQFFAGVAWLYAHPLERSRDEVSLADGRTLDRCSAPLVGPSGTRFGRAWFFRDITEARQREAELRRYQERLEDLVRERTAQADAASRAKSAFLANMSHQIRTPLNAILGFAQVLERDAALAPEQRGHLATITRSGEHLLELIDDVLDMASIEAGRARLAPTTFDLPALVRDIQRRHRAPAEHKRLTLTLRLDGELPGAVVGDRDKLRHILDHLLGNAVKFTARGGIEVRLRAARGAAGEVRLGGEVEDTGPGIPAESLARLFRPFEQAAGGGPTGVGTGLGLAISRELARLMGGDLTVTTEVGRGSTFRFEVRLEEGAVGAVAAAPATPPAAAPAPATALGPAFVASIPAPLAAELRQAADSADLDGLLGLIARIPGAPAAALAELRQIAEGFDYERLNELFREASP